MKLLKRAMQLIKENQYRMSVVFLSVISLFSLVYFFVEINRDASNLWDILSNPWNILVILLALYTGVQVKPLVHAIWEQTGIRDEIEKETARKLGLENRLLELQIRKMEKSL